MAAVRSLLLGVLPVGEKEKVCMECKRQQAVCVLVSQGKPCMGPVTKTGCGALCPRFGRDCYGCYGPSESINGQALGKRFEGLGLPPEEIAGRFVSFNSGAAAFLTAGRQWMTDGD